MEIKGVGIGRGVAVGSVIRMAAPLPEPSDAPRADTVPAQGEIDRVTKSLAVVNADLSRRAEEAANGDEGAKKAAPILQAISMFASDPSLAASITSLINGGKTAERAVLEGFAAVEDMFRAIGGYQAERAADLHDVGQRVIADLMGVPAPGIPESETPFVLVAEDLSPRGHRRNRPEQGAGHRHFAGRPHFAHRHSGPRSRHRGRGLRRRSREPDQW
ncbi:Phosphoenolpyruvate-protein phosphotransferase [Bifidobacterium breve]|nr:Phosphoenolpyruvate-protein phosphotransferase [Bifidobacterium breve]